MPWSLTPRRRHDPELMDTPGLPEAEVADAYRVLSRVIMLPQGDLGNAFRFGAVLFPLLFLVGDWFAARPEWLRWSVAVLTLWLNHKVTHAFSIGAWAY